MNINEVVSNLDPIFRESYRAKEPIHPNDDVNLERSSNDIPTVLHVSVVLAQDQGASSFNTSAEA